LEKTSPPVGVLLTVLGAQVS